MGSACPLTGRSILIVEDEPLIAVHLQALFESVGAKVRCVQTLKRAADLVEEETFAAPLLDYRLGAGHVSVLCRRLAKRNVPFMFYSGYAHIPGYPGVIVIQKPATVDVLLEAMARLVDPPLARIVA